MLQTKTHDAFDSLPSSELIQSQLVYWNHQIGHIFQHCPRTDITALISTSQLTPCLSRTWLWSNCRNPLQIFLFFFSLSLTHSFPLCLLRIGIPDSAVINIQFSCGPSHQSLLLLVSIAFPRRERTPKQTAHCWISCASLSPQIDFSSPFIFLLWPTSWAGRAVGSGVDWRHSVCWCWSSGWGRAGPWRWTRFLWVQSQTHHSESRMRTQYSTDTRGTGYGTSSSSWRSTQEMTLSTSARWVSSTNLR